MTTGLTTDLRAGVTADSAPTPPTRGGARLEVRELGVQRGRITVLDGVSVQVEPGSWTAVVGPNGAGKSTVLRSVAGLLPHRGQILLDGQDVLGLSPRARAIAVAYAPQLPVLPGGIDVREYVLLGRTPHRRVLTGPGRADQQIVDQALERLDLARLATRSLRTLSGGERQRAALARALAQQPRLLLLDEPTTSLDLGHAQQVLELVDQLRRDDGTTVVCTLHDLVLAGQFADQLLLLADGRARGTGAPERVLTAEALAAHYGARADVTVDAGGLRIHPVRSTPTRGLQQ